MPIGEGKFSICYRGYLHGTPVAVKVLKVTSLNEQVIQSFNHEVGIMSDIKHPNLLVFLGIL
jgi:serine/threonine protein kinase